MTDSVIYCDKVEKTFTTYVRQKGVMGILRNFFNRKMVDFQALSDINLDIKKGEFIGLIGENGAGKTTLVKILSGIIPNTGGTCELFGRDCFHLRNREKRRLALVMGQRSQLWWDLPAIDSFRLLKEIYQVKESDFQDRLKRYAERLEVTQQLHIQLRNLSLGQRMKMEIIGAFLHQPDMVFLDEPTIGLDLVSRETIRRFLIELNRDRQVTIMLTSHDMEDIEQTCKRIVILDAGKILFDGDILDLKGKIHDRRMVEAHLVPGQDLWTEDMAKQAVALGAVLTRETNQALTFAVDKGEVRAFMRWLLEQIDVKDIAVERQPLEFLIRDIFLTGEVDGGPQEAGANGVDKQNGLELTDIAAGNDSEPSSGGG